MELHEQKNFAYPLPPMGGPGFAFGVVGEENGRVEQVAFLTLVPEAYLLANEKFGTPEKRWENLKDIHEAVRLLALRRGYHAVYCWVPPELSMPCAKRLNFWQRLRHAWDVFWIKEIHGCEKAFVRRLNKLGWVEDEWRNFVFNIEE